MCRVPAGTAGTDTHVPLFLSEFYYEYFNCWILASLGPVLTLFIDRNLQTENINEKVATMDLPAWNIKISTTNNEQHPEHYFHSSQDTQEALLAFWLFRTMTVPKCQEGAINFDTTYLGRETKA